MIKAGNVLLISFFILFMGCVSDIVLDIELPPPCAVLNANISEDSVISATISCSTNSIKGDVNYEKEQLFINDAVVELFINNISQGIMSKGEEEGQYLMPNCYPSAGDKVRMEVQTKEYEPIYAETILQERPEIIRVDTQMIIHDYMESHLYKALSLNLNLKFKENPNEKNYYMIIFAGCEVTKTDTIKTVYERINVRHNKELLLEDVFLNRHDYYYYYSTSYEDFYPTSYEDFSTSFIFTDDLIKGDECELEFTLEGDLHFSYYSDTLSITNMCMIELASISESYYLYLRSKTLQYKQKIDAFGGIGLREPIPTYSNIINGFGLLSAKQSTCINMEIQSSDKKDTSTMN